MHDGRVAAAHSFGQDGPHHRDGELSAARDPDIEVPHVGRRKGPEVHGLTVEEAILPPVADHQEAPVEEVVAVAAPLAVGVATRTGLGPP